MPKARTNRGSQNPLRANKSLGQHFLADPRVKARIIAACDIAPDDQVLEIGPGQGALTRDLVKMAGHVWGVEKDPRMCQFLAGDISGEKFTCLEKDFLDLDLSGLPPGMRVVGNLPYYISTPIIEKCLTGIERFRDLSFTVQWEFGKRLAAKPGTKDYGSLTCFVQYHCSVKVLFKISRAAFQPPPKVDSCFIRLSPRTPPLTCQDSSWLWQIVQTAFQQRRKKITNSLAELTSRPDLEQALTTLGLNGNLRAENLSLTDYIQLSDLLKRISEGG